MLYFYYIYLKAYITSPLYLCCKALHLQPMNHTVSL